MRAVVNVATGRYVKGQERLTEWLAANGEEYFIWRDRLPDGCPSHSDIPYAFKAYALRHAISAGATTLLWADASVVPIKPLDPLWDRIERNGYWIGNNGWTNYQWTADDAYQDLFPGLSLTQAREQNRRIKHVVAGSFGLDVLHPIGRAIFEEYYRLAATTMAFWGPWSNVPSEPCGPPDVLGHRHDQTALSVLAWRFGCELTNSPNILAYSPGQTDETILLLEGIC